MNEGQSKKLVSKPLLDHWYRAYTPSLQHKLRKYGLNTQETEDIVHETWLQVMRTGYDGAGVFSMYLQRIAERKALDALRKRLKHTPVTRDMSYMPSDTTEVRKLLRFACLQLSLSQQMAFITISYAGLSYAEASRMLNAPIPTLRTRIRRATALLREPARYTSFPCSIALPVGYGPRDEGWMMQPQDRHEYTVFTRSEETPALEVVCWYANE